MVLGREEEMKRKIFGGGNIFGCRRKKKEKERKENVWRKKIFGKENILSKEEKKK